MSKQFKVIILRHMVVVATIALLIYLTFSFTGFDGLVCRGLNDNLGEVASGKDVESTLRLTNFGMSPVSILRPATCGCEVNTGSMLTIAPLGGLSIPVVFRVSAKEHGWRKRIVQLFVQRGDKVHQFSGTVTFLVH